MGDSLAGGGVLLVDSAASGVGVGLAAGAAVSVFCSQAARSAAPARMEMYFFIDKRFRYLMIRRKRVRRIGKFRLEGRFVFQTVRFSDGLTG